MTFAFGQQSFRQVKFGSGSTILKATADRPISLDEIAARAPAVFAQEKHESRSERYEYIDTRAIMAGLIQNGFGVFEVRQGGSRVPGKREFTKHMLRLRYMGEQGHHALINGFDRIVPEVVITNAHDGTASWQMGAGCFRIVCTNGLVAGDMFDYVRIRHNRAGPEQVIEGAYRVIEQFPRMIEGAQIMGETKLDNAERLLFANAARQLRWDGDEAAPPVEAETLIQPRRAADRSNDLWSTFNVAQEHLLRGGDRYVHRSDTGRRSVRQTGEIRSIDDTNKLNRALWTLSQGMADLKAGRELRAA